MQVMTKEFGSQISLEEGVGGIDIGNLFGKEWRWVGGGTGPHDLDRIILFGITLRLTQVELKQRLLLKIWNFFITFSVISIVALLV